MLTYGLKASKWQLKVYNIIIIFRIPMLYWLGGCCTYAEPDPGEHMDSCL